MFLLKEHWVGGNLTFFRTFLTKYEEGAPFLLQNLREFLRYVLYFFTFRRLNWTKKEPPESLIWHFQTL